MRLASAVLACALLAACGASSVRPNIAKTKWIELSSRHFKLTTDLRLSAANILIVELEGYWQSIADNYGLILPGKPLPSSQMRLVHLASCEDFGEIVWRDRIGGYVDSSNDFTNERVVVTCQRKSVSGQVLIHELVHRFNRHFFLLLPTWLNEGLASFFQTLEVGNGRVRIGTANAMDHGFWRSTHRLPKVRDLVSYSNARFHEAPDRRNYFASWLLVHLLTNSSDSYRERFREYLLAVSNGGDSTDSWKQIFGGEMDTLEKDYQRYFRKRKPQILGAAYNPITTAAGVTTRELDPGEIHMVWMRLLMTKANYTQKAEDREAVGKQLKIATRDVQDWSGLLLWTALYQHWLGKDAKVTLPLLRKYLSRNPSDGRALSGVVEIQLGEHTPENYYGFGAVPSGLSEVEGDVMALVRVAKTPNELNLVAYYFALQQKPVTGLNFARRALAEDRSCISCLDSLALLLFHQGKVAEALSTQQRAVNGVSEAGEVPAFSRRLKHYKKSLNLP